MVVSKTAYGSLGGIKKLSQLASLNKQFVAGKQSREEIFGEVLQEGLQEGLSNCTQYKSLGKSNKGSHRKSKS